MQEKFFKQFIDFLEDYIDEEITHDEKYIILLNKCTTLEKNSSSREHKCACEELDYCYRRLMFEKMVFYCGEFVRWLVK